ncbi:MAG: Predicted mannose-6-phosphate isomerase, partial [uncultured Acetobacteraceae bacterium]
AARRAPPRPRRADRRLEAQRGARDPGRQPRHQHPANPGHEPRRGDQRGAGRRAKDLGRHGPHPRQRQDRRPPPRRAGKRDLRAQGPRPDALGRAAGVRGRGRAGRLHLRAALRAASGDQRLHGRDPRMPAGALRQRGRGGEPRHRAGGTAGERRLGGPDPQGAGEL